MIKEIEIKSANPFAKRVEFILDDISVGYLEYSLIYDRMELDNIKVLEEYRNKGIGSRLMAYLISVAIDHHVINITLEVRLSNEIARNMYKKFGFREVALRKFYYGDEDGVLMEKNIM